MSGKIPRAFIDDLIQRVDIVDLINSHIPLKKSGANYVAQCPFHSEKTPSFSVSRAKQFFYCFGCGAAGNVIGFLMQYGHLGFTEAVEDIASMVGLEVPTDGKTVDTEQEGRLKALYQLQLDVARHYQTQLKIKKDAISYLKGRDLTGDIVKRFGIGYALPEWNDLGSHFDHKLLLESGLNIRHESGRTYDRFRNRIMFPIRDRRGRVIGFGGRVLDDSTPKYLNSPETPTFHKSKEVYGLYELLESCSKPDRIVVVEGYMDVTALAQYGIPYAVAALGTATSREHMDLLFRFTSELVFCFDGDNAGQKAAWRALETALPVVRDNRQIRFMLLPQGHDPDSLVRLQGKEKFTQSVADSKLLSDYFFEQIMAAKDLTRIEGRTALVQEAKPLLTRIPNSLFRDMMFARLTEISGLSIKPDQTANLRNQKKSNRKGSTRSKPSTIRTALALLLQHPDLVQHIKPLPSEWNDSKLPGLDSLKRLSSIILNHPDVNVGGILEEFRGLPEEKYMIKLLQWDTLTPATGVETEFKGAIDRIREQINRQDLANLLEKAGAKQLSAAEQKRMQELLTLSKTR